MHIIHIAAELAPIAKVGGLGDVLYGLCRSLAEKKQKVEVILPKYDVLHLDRIENLKALSSPMFIDFDGQPALNTIWKGYVEGISVILIESHHFFKPFERGKVYGCEDDIARFCYFCLATLAYIQQFPCDIIHIHDWHTALIAGLIKERYKDISSKVLFTIHNLSYQGVCREEDLNRIGWKHTQLQEGPFYNLMKGGIVFADHITTVSPRYAQEILTSELGGNLQSILQQHCKKISGVLNGIDYTYWNPATDPLLPYHYSSEDTRNKSKIKNELQKRLSLTIEQSPLVGSVTRLVYQKNPELLKACILRTLEWGGQFVLLGAVSDETTQTHFSNLKHKLKGCSHIHLELVYDEELSHLFYAGADLFLIPSVFEPCGLTQMIAMRYGTVPLARNTGGLADTVFEEKNGFLFGPPTIESIHHALDRALETWHYKPDLWQKLLQTGMQSDFSWNQASQEYLKIYNALVQQ